MSVKQYAMINPYFVYKVLISSGGLGVALLVFAK